MDHLKSGTNRHVLVLGAGVSGLATALCLRRRGFAVTVVAEKFAPRVTSNAAGALWEWPPAVCGRYFDADSLRRARGWSEISYRTFCELSADPMAGVFLRPVNFYFKHAVADRPAALAKMTELAGKVHGFRHDARLIAENGVNPALGYRDAYAHLAPMIDTDVYLRWLVGRVRQAGCRVTEGRVIGPLAEVARNFHADALVNCTGLGAAELTGDEVYPVRGALVRVRNDGRAGPRIDQAHCVSHDGTEDDTGFIFILPRGDDMLVLGGLAQPGERRLDIGLHNCDAVKLMYQRCIDFMPTLANLPIDLGEPVRVGLRPFRRRNVRLETEPGAPIIHNYGHGGSGVTLSWGCAAEATDRVEEALG